MGTKVWMRLGTAALAVIAALGVAGCNPIALVPSGGPGTGTCVSGSWVLDAETILAPLSTAVGPITVTTSGPGVTMTFTDTTWALHADQTLSGSASTHWGTVSGSLHVLADASGTYSSTGTAITFQLQNLTGTADYDVTLPSGQHVTGTFDLAHSGVAHLYGLSATAALTCNSSGLTLQFASHRMHEHHH